MLSDTLFNKVDIKLADAFDFLAAQESNSIDLIFTSPPYAERRKNHYGGISPKLYVKWWMPIADQMLRTLKPTGSLILNIKEHSEGGIRHPYVYKLVLAMIEQAGWQWLDELVWNKTNAVPFTFPTKLRDAWERLYHFAPTTNIKFRPDAIRVPPAASTIHRYTNATEQDKIKRPSATGSGFNIKIPPLEVLEKGIIPPNVITGGVIGKDVGHPAAMPPYLPDFFIKLLTDEGDLVCDPFAGTGTTLKSALRLGRDAIGCDINPYFMGGGGDQNGD